MVLGKREPAWEREWRLLIQKEEQFGKKQMAVKTSFINEKLEKVVPMALKEKLDLAFYKAFEVVFEKGTVVIEKTYSKSQAEQDYKVNEFAADLKQDRKSVRAFSRQAGTANMKNLLVSGVEGIGLGVLGVGIPDIPLFTGLLLKSVYEVAMSFGYGYDTEEEKIFILKLIQAAMEQGEEWTLLNQEIDVLLTGEQTITETRKEQIQKTAQTMSRELLYMKFLQGIPIAGVIGGLSDAVYLKKVTDYAAIKYQKGLLMKKR